MKKLSINRKRDWLIISSVFLIINFFFFVLVRLLLKGGIGTVYSNWDAPSYVMAAVSLYDPQLAFDNNILASPLITPTWSFLPAHFPLYPLLIRAFSFLGYFRASMIISLAFALLTVISFYELIRTHKLARSPLLLTLPLILLSPRWFAIYHVGSTEPLFLFFLLNSLSSFLSGKHGKSALWAAFAQLTRPQGALLGVAYAILALVDLAKSRDLRKVVQTYTPYLLIPLTLLSVFSFFYFRTGNYWAFFESIKVFRHFHWSLFPTFNYPAGVNIETFWQEVNVYDYILAASAIYILFAKKLTAPATIATTFLIPLIFISHSDISRYGLPLLPFVFIAFSDLIERREFVIGTFLMSPAVMLYTINFMAFNHGA